MTHMHGLAVYVKEGLPFACDLPLENSQDSHLYFTNGFTTLCVLLIFSLSITFFNFMPVFLFYFI